MANTEENNSSSKLKKKSEYRSARRSRKLIRSALIELLDEKEFSKITVTDIVNRADINRGTFYSHYADTRAIVEEIEEEFVLRLESAFCDFHFESFFRDPLPILQRIAQSLQKDSDDYRILLKSIGPTHFFQKVQKLFLVHASSDLTIPEEVRTSPRFLLQVQFYAAGTCSLFQSWLCGETDFTPEEITAEISNLIKGNADRIYAIT